MNFPRWREVMTEVRSNRRRGQTTNNYMEKSTMIEFKVNITSDHVVALLRATAKVIGAITTLLIVLQGMFK